MAQIIKVEDAKRAIVDNVKRACVESYDAIEPYVDLVIDIMTDIYADAYDEPAPKTAWWNKCKNADGEDRWICSRCSSAQAYGPTKYCPNCGAEIGEEPLTTGTSFYLGGPWSIKAEDIT